MSSDEFIVKTENLIYYETIREYCYGEFLISNTFIYVYWHHVFMQTKVTGFRALLYLGGNMILRVSITISAYNN